MRKRTVAVFLALALVLGQPVPSRAFVGLGAFAVAMEATKVVRFALIWISGLTGGAAFLKAKEHLEKGEGSSR